MYPAKKTTTSSRQFQWYSRAAPMNGSRAAVAATASAAAARKRWLVRTAGYAPVPSGPCVH